MTARRRSAAAGRGRDRVDEAIDALSRNCPDVDLASLEIFGRLTRLGRLVEAFLDRVPGAGELAPTDVAALLLLERRAPEPATPSEIGQAVLRSSAAITAVLDRLEKRGLIRRIANRSDRRSVHIELTHAGHQRARSHVRDSMRAQDEILFRLAETDRKRIETSLRVLLALMEDWLREQDADVSLRKTAARTGTED